MELIRRLLAYQKDTWGHLIVGWLIVSGLHLAGVGVAFSFIGAIVAGALKEGYDHAHPKAHTADSIDFYATALGALISANMIIIFEYFFL